MFKINKPDKATREMLKNLQLEYLGVFKRELGEISKAANAKEDSQLNYN